jgi:hypothetical protein
LCNRRTRHARERETSQSNIEPWVAVGEKQQERDGEHGDNSKFDHNFARTVVELAFMLSARFGFRRK